MMQQLLLAMGGLPPQQTWSDRMTGTWSNITNAYDNDESTYAQISGLGDPETVTLLDPNPTIDATSSIQIKGHCTNGQIRIGVPGANSIDFYSQGGDSGIQTRTFSTTATIGPVTAMSVSPNTAFRLYFVKFDGILLINGGPGF